MTINYNFEWDPIKARKNLNKHKVAFDEAATIFQDSKALSIFDPDHSELEDRWITIGFSEKGRVLIVTHTVIEENETSIMSKDHIKQKSNKERN